MSICINNDLIWISVPRCASMSIEKSIVNHPHIKYQHINSINPKFEKMKDAHLHVNIDDLTVYFGKMETVCIKRNWFERWLSSFEYIWQSIEFNKLTPKYNYEEVDNDFIYNIFSNSFINKLEFENSDDDIISLFLLFINESLDEFKDKNIRYTGIRLLSSQNIWTSNEKCTYEFDINELYKFENFISNRYNIDFKIEHINRSKKLKNKIVINDELKNFIWNKFEKPYIKINKII
jgi:hypothetical protein